MRGYVLVPYVGNYWVPVEDAESEEDAWKKASEKLYEASSSQKDEWIIEEEYLDRIQEPCGTANYSCQCEWYFDEEKEL